MMPTPTPPPPPPTLMMACNDTVASVYTLPTGLPAYDSSHRGDVVRCAYDRYFSAAQLTSGARALGFTGPAATTGAWQFRIAYRTERVTPANGPAPEGDTTALLLIPDKPKSGAPLLGLAHPSVGMADACAPSRVDPLQANLASVVSNTDSFQMELSLAGYGWPIIMPDYVGFNYGQAPGWSEAEDEAHTMLDATRAAAKLLPAMPTNVVMLGHSQGGHVVLSADAYAKSYGMAGTLVAVAAFAPFWISSYVWAAVIDPAAGATTAKNNGLILFDMEYFYGHGELYDGPGGGLAMFAAAKRDAVKQFLYSDQCLNAQTSTLGTYPSDFYDAAFENSMSGCGTGFGPCNDATATTWTTRFKADRPAIDANGPPILVWSGGKDSYFPPPYAQCSLDKLNADLTAAGQATTTITSCLDPNATHTGTGAIVQLDLDWGAQWLLWKAGVGAQPAACSGLAAGTKCMSPPPNL
jgi:pimeloyl-ACP methyl ester carboxylesterase